MSALLNFFSYFSSWFLVAFIILLAVICEKIYSKGAVLLFARQKKISTTGVGFFYIFRKAINLPNNASKGALYLPAFAIATQVAVCTALPYCAFIPIIENDSDVMQLIQFMLLSEVCVIFSLYLLKTNSAVEIAHRELKGAFCLLSVLVLFFASLAYYVTCNGLDTDAFSLNSFSTTDTLMSMSIYGLLGISIFIIVILNSIPQYDAYSGFIIIADDEIPEYQGISRQILQLCGVLRSFITVSIVTFVIFPTEMLTSLSTVLGISWRGQALNFLLFWVVVMLVRFIFVPLSKMLISFLISFIEKKLKHHLELVIPFLVFAAMLLIWYEGILLSQEAAVY